MNPKLNSYDYTQRDFVSIMNILDAIEKISNYTDTHSHADSLYNDNKSFDAVLMNFIIIGEMAARLSDDFRAQTDDIVNWFKIVGFRNIIAHNYFGVDAEEVWQIIQENLPELYKLLYNVMK